MRAAVQQSWDGPGALTIADRPDPVAGDDQLLIAVQAASVVFPDLLQTQGRYQVKTDPPYVPGGVAAGTVCHATGPFEAGDRVVAVTGVGAWADLVAAPVVHTLRLPEHLSFEQAAAMLINYGTAYFALARRGHIAAGETVLVHGAAGGVGTATLDIVRALGARSIAVVSSAEKAEVARKAGADEVIGPEEFKQAVLSLTGGRGVDIVVDPVGGDRFTDSLRCLAPEGRLLVVGFAGGEIPAVKVNRLLLNNTTVTGVAWGAFWTTTDPHYLQREWTELTALLDRLAPVISSAYSLEQAPDALRALDERRALGNLILRLGDEASPEA